jgi:hypothetical protein
MRVSDDPEECAAMLCDRHLMAQINEASLALRGLWRYHPVTRWANVSRGNYLWLARLARACCVEYEHRFGRRHATHGVLFGSDHFVESRASEVPDGSATPLKLTPGVDAGNTVKAYRIYLRRRHAEWAEAEKPRARWTRRRAPEWEAGPAY